MLDVRSKDRIGNRAGASLPVGPLCRLVPLRPRRFTTQESLAEHCTSQGLQRYRFAERQVCREAGWQRGRLAERQGGRETGWQRDGFAEIQVGRETGWQRDKFCREST